jgi:hypothetical protein
MKKLTILGGILAPFVCSLPACKQTPTVTDGARPPSAVQADLGPSGPTAKPSTPLQLGPLKLESPDSVLKKVGQAQYDPAELGLQELRFKVKFTHSRNRTEVEASAHWRKEHRSPVVVLQTVRRDERAVENKEEVGQRVWQLLQARLVGLLEGVGHGFLRQRLAEWQHQPEKQIQEKDRKLVLVLPRGEDPTTIRVGDGYRVEQVSRVSKKGVTRSMDYEWHTVGGRHLVHRAIMRIAIAPESKLPEKDRLMLSWSNETSYELRYKPISGYHLPVFMRRRAPKSNDLTELQITYTLVR